MDYIGIFDLGILGHLIQSFAVDGAGTAVDVSGIDALTNDRGERSGAAEVLYGVRVVARIELDDLRRGTAGTAEILKRQTVARLCGDCRQVERGVGGAAHHHINAQGIFERLPRDDVAGLEILPDHLHNALTGPFCQKGNCEEGSMSCGVPIPKEWSPLEIMRADYPLLVERRETVYEN